MSNFQGHLKFGILSSIALSAGYGAAYYLQGQEISPDKIGIIAGLTLVASLAPDLDIKSHPQKWTALLLGLFGIYSLYIKETQYYVLASIAFLFISASRHRGWSHSFLWPVVLVLLFFVSFNPYLLAVALGLLTHYTLDRMSPLKQINWIKPYIL